VRGAASAVSVGGVWLVLTGFEQNVWSTLTVPSDKGGVRAVVREEARLNGDVHGGHSRWGAATGASPFLIGLVSIGLVTWFAMPDGGDAVVRAAGDRGPSPARRRGAPVRGRELAGRRRS
jgi:hypothetical protein